MGELKSAWQIAEERANRLGKLSTEERKEQERQRYFQIGQVLAQKWLNSSPQVDITTELNRQDENGRETVKEAVVHYLVQTMEFTSPQAINRARRIMDAVGNLEPKLQSTAHEMVRVFEEYEATERNIKRELETKYRETLHRLRISGTAVAGINLEASDEWQLAHRKLLEAFAPRLNSLKQSLMR